jgi:1,4-alpha-glucan branching enzyme
VWRKFASLRTLFLYQMSHPGAKLNFMGSEFGQFIEWRYYEQLEWFMLDYESHRLLQDFNSKLNRFYIDHPQLWEDDHTWAGFEWIDASDTKNNVFIYKRSCPEPEYKDVYVALNMVPQPLEEYKIPVYELGTYKIVLNTDDMSFGGSGYPTATDVNGCVEAVDEEYNGKPYYIKLNLPPLAGIYFMKVAEPKKPEKKTKKIEKKVEKKAASKPDAKTAKKTAKSAAKKSEKKPAEVKTTETKTAGDKAKADKPK